MREFFKPWRRKVGVVALVMACVFAAGWVRSFSVQDYFTFASKTRSAETILSNCGVIGWVHHPHNILQRSRSFGSQAAYDLDKTIRVDLLTWDCRNLPRWRFIGFGGWERPFSPSTRMTLTIVPYWSIVLPLTLLSAYLLLSKPRATTPMKTSEPAPAQAS